MYVVEPKEYAQNISYVEANEKMTNLMFMLDALFQTKGAGLKTYMESLKKRQEQMHSILREPLVVGYADKYNKFGWLLGPRFQLGKKNQFFSYSRVQYSLQASIVVPCWFNEISISKKCYWGKHELKDTQSNEEGQSTFKHIRLNPDISMITAALLGRVGAYRQPASLDLKPYSIRAGIENEQLLIHGDHLWKNPEVFVGNNKAESVILMPDMRTIHATFKNKFPAPKDNEPDGTKTDLTVITSDGDATIKAGVTILPPTKKEEVQAHHASLVEGLSPYTWYGHEFKISVSVELLPKNYSQKLHIRKKGAPKWVPCLTQKIEKNTQKNFVEIAFKEKK